MSTWRSRSPLLLLGIIIVISADAGTDTHRTADTRQGPRYEQARQQRLARVQSSKQNHLSTFTTDGCSGGLSDGWRFLAHHLPAFGKTFGQNPPYEDCCVAHDLAYWRGETRHGYEKRLQADNRLRQCVITYGKLHSSEFARQFKLPASIIERNFRIVAELMYRSVRVGGMPCTGLPWRWGYGWPTCSVVRIYGDI